ncbi:MAG: hypothetical protein HC805_05010, partial [Alkalinema sp. RL_2_19]|nr:hypothetical protein [Alkalinema sp. RL_2_19]
MSDLNAVVSSIVARSTDLSGEDQLSLPNSVADFALVPPQRLQAVIQEQQCRFPLLDDRKDLVAVCDFNGFLAYLNPIGRELMGLSPDDDLSLFQVRCFTPLTQDLWDEIFTSLLEAGLWSGEHILQYGGDPIPRQNASYGLYRPNLADHGEIDCFTIVARTQGAP